MPHFALEITTKWRLIASISSWLPDPSSIILLSLKARLESAFVARKADCAFEEAEAQADEELGAVLYALCWLESCAAPRGFHFSFVPSRRDRLMIWSGLCGMVGSRRWS